MSKNPLEQPIAGLKGVGKARAALFARRGVTDVAGLLRYYPRSYEDRGRIVSVADLADGESACVRAVLHGSPMLVRAKSGRRFVRAAAADESGVVDLFFFNADYMKEQLAAGEEYIFFGQAQRQGRRVTMVNPVAERASEEGRRTGRLMPLYPLTAGLSNAQAIRAAEQALTFLEHVPETLPEALRERYGLTGIRAALRGIHAPGDEGELQAARRRLAFEELYYFALGLTLRSAREPDGPPGPLMTPHDPSPFWAALGFAPTEAQRRCVREALADMCRGGPPMRRLLQGDVGSGKTAVAAACVWAAAQNGWQTALMAPTEILAEQHFRTLDKLLSPLGLRVELLTAGRNAPTRRAVGQALSQGLAHLCVGTHALLSEGVEFDRLGLVVTDEQHRFGVEQRTKLSQKGENPHMLVMSATPIPRTLALALYGDLDISVLDEMPPGRSPVETRIVSEKKREMVYGFMRTQFLQGRQGYVICPAIEPDEENETLRSVESHTQTLREIFTEFKVDCLHGRLSAPEKEAVMRAFAGGETTLLVSTTVVEVGVDVPNAAVMVIENAERFGLSQLHQLRGRVGRGTHRSYCVLFTQSAASETRARLDALCQSNDGFFLAREDLRLRGPGDFFGQRQSGVPGLHAAALGADMELFEQARDAAKDTLSRDPALSSPENAPAAARVGEMFSVASD